MADPDLLKSLGNPEAQEEKILEEEGLGENDQPAAAVFQSACSRFRNDAAFKQQIAKIEGHYMKSKVDDIQSSKNIEEKSNKTK